MRSPLAALVCGIAVGALVALAPATWGATTLRAWRDGPVGNLLTEAEYRRFGELGTDAERRGFIEAFWRGIDGDAPGSESRYRETFEARCGTVNARFESSAQEGWRTDRGRVFLALGEPSGILREPGDVTAVEKEVWMYGSPEEPETLLRIVFHRCADGNYWLDARCVIEHDPTSVAYDGERADYLRRLRDNNPAINRRRLFALLNGLFWPPKEGIPRPRRPESIARTTLAPVGPTSMHDTSRLAVHALENAAYFFRAEDGTVLTLLALELLVRPDHEAIVADPGAAPYLGAVSFEETGRGGETLPDASVRRLTLDAAPGAGEGGHAVFFGQVHLEAGRTYAARYAVEDGAREAIFVRNAQLGVPDLSTGFTASSIVPAEQFGPAGPDSGRFQVGSEAVVPKAGGAFRRSELLRLYLQVYDAALDPSTAKARVDVVFRFYRSVKRSAKRFGKPFSVRGATGASMGLALPIGDWPAGSYLVSVELHDRVAERRTTAEGRFSIVAE